MSRKTTQTLPSLACPFIGGSNGVWKKEKGLFLPPFPEIDLDNWDGFTYSYLPWVGLSQDSSEDQEFERLIQILHEFAHRQLAILPFPLLQKFDMFLLYEHILWTFRRGQQIRVPLVSNKPGNKLRKHWEYIVRQKRAADIVEEVYAVRTSLLKARQAGEISHSEQKDKAEQYKSGYGEFIPEYVETYEAFDYVASQIGETAANGMIFHSLLTCDPDVAFAYTLYEMHKIDSRDRDFLRNLSREPHEGAIDEAMNFFSKVIWRLDPDDSRFKRGDMADLDKDFAEYIRKDCHILLHYLEEDFSKFLFNEPYYYLTSVYIAKESHITIMFFEVDGSKKQRWKEIEYKSIVLLLEAIRQQLSRGIGLLCPFWLYSAPHYCCSVRNREILEKAWQCTSKSECERWKRMGCLQDKPGQSILYTPVRK